MIAQIVVHAATPVALCPRQEAVSGAVTPSLRPLVLVLDHAIQDLIERIADIARQRPRIEAGQAL
jgi:hypothetical protein